MTLDLKSEAPIWNCEDAIYVLMKTSVNGVYETSSLRQFYGLLGSWNSLSNDM